MDKDFYKDFLRKIFVKIFVVCEGLERYQHIYINFFNIIQPAWDSELAFTNSVEVTATGLFFSNSSVYIHCKLLT